ncbi:hypothetical protein K438DRAFT_683437 [Mycena galopus ATCC 62051]|nr:hypothetical protein K438DRAFT_683437 [Mycena galopus ATCC 62051]
MWLPQALGFAPGVRNPFPFIFALGGSLASLPKELIDHANSSGKGLVCDFWVGQRAILQHDTVESLSQGIPLIIWPTNAEQPVNAVLLSSEPVLVAIELLQNSGHRSVTGLPSQAPSLTRRTSSDWSSRQLAEVEAWCCPWTRGRLATF